MRWPGIEPGSTAWKATMLTIIPPSLKSNAKIYIYISVYFYFRFSLKNKLQRR